ncbi:NADPH-dependent FMN reductase [Terrabacter sp. C0L_2]|uniref:NADPH-dependent FMN reductase n=1 Tax=Terrabacter sp. C0L_2 TaxID=3108389 RepID=UPI002ED123DF|nr:NAD(P)H-dependent oxidoreductase [Terrabacter sp. C0L_2]
MTHPTLQIILASTRPGRRGGAVAEWMQHVAREQAGFTIEVVDLAEVGLPLLDEPHHPRLQQYTRDHTKAWSATINRAHAFVFVMPEYNHSFPAALKNALDYLFVEWADKPVGLVSYGGVSAGLRSAAAIKPVLTALRMVPALEAVSIPNVNELLSEDGEMRADAGLDAAAKAMLDEVARLAHVLMPLRVPA